MVNVKNGNLPVCQLLPWNKQNFKFNCQKSLESIDFRVLVMFSIVVNPCRSSLIYRAVKGLECPLRSHLYLCSPVFLISYQDSKREIRRQDWRLWISQREVYHWQGIDATYEGTVCCHASFTQGWRGSCLDIQPYCILSHWTPIFKPLCYLWISIASPVMCMYQPRAYFCSWGSSIRILGVSVIGGWFNYLEGIHSHFRICVCIEY